MTILRFGIAIVVAVATAGCLTLKVTVAPGEYRQETEVVQSFELTNRSSVPVRVCRPPGVVVDKILLGGRRITAGGWVPVRFYDLARGLSYRWLKPHEVVRWGGVELIGGVRDDEVFYYRLERAGTYRVRYVYRCPGGAPMEVFSNWISLTIDPNKPITPAPPLQLPVFAAPPQ